MTSTSTSTTTPRTNVDPDLAWRLAVDAQDPDRVADRAREVAGRQVAVLAAITAAVWLFDLVQVVAQ